MNKPQKEGEIWEQPFLHEHPPVKTQAVMTHRVLSKCAPTWGPAQAGHPPDLACWLLGHTPTCQ